MIKKSKDKRKKSTDRKKTATKYGKKSASKNRKKKKITVLGLLCTIIKFICVSIFKIGKFLIFKSIDLRKRRKEHEFYDKKIFSTRCNLITLGVVLLSVCFVFVEKSIFYAYPLLTCILPFMKLSEGINLDVYNQYKDLKLYNSILKINAFILGFVVIGWYQELWFINVLSTTTFIIPYIVGNINKEENWEIYDNKYREI